MDNTVKGVRVGSQKSESREMLVVSPKRHLRGMRSAVSRRSSWLVVLFKQPLLRIGLISIKEIMRVEPAMILRGDLALLKDSYM